MGGYLRQLLSFSSSHNLFYLKVLKLLLRFITLSIFIISSHLKLSKARRKCLRQIRRKVRTFPIKIYKNATGAENIERCVICLAEYEEDDVASEVSECRHSFHRHCLRRWLMEAAGTCPLCRCVVVAEEAVAEYHRKLEYRGRDRIDEVEFAIILIRVLTLVAAVGNCCSNGGVIC
ncbi:E3 ubiquitin-protein ligase ATL59-like [Andrographis paniculata]|uniref:E3 ubiquitin-protein ligase ATL59-like n=1 Tax=Andrographis paniculata TaxID=175694 RepID=UPI0021E93F23|nr:E3 ubiquitin-protein ligase ATL59-like [Andrographis paniculata]